MTSNVREFNLELDRFIGKQLPAAALAAHKKLTMNALKGVVKKSPVQTGRFRGNWQVSAGTPIEMATSEIDKQAYGNDPKKGTEDAAIAGMRGLQPYSITYLQNNLPYAEKLEFGSSSTQAPSGMVAVTIAELQHQIIEELDLPRQPV